MEDRIEQSKYYTSEIGPESCIADLDHLSNRRNHRKLLDTKTNSIHSHKFKYTIYMIFNYYKHRI